MVSEVSDGSSVFYQCSECGFIYASRELAEKCEAWCSENRSCNLSITAHAVRKEEKFHDKIQMP